MLCRNETEKDDVVRGGEEGMKIRKGKKYRDRAVIYLEERERLTANQEK
jgi:hypothetical protein